MTQTIVPAYAIDQRVFPQINYNTNPNAESGTSGWNVYANTAQATPVNGLGGSPGITFAAVSVGAIRGGSSFQISKPASNQQGNGVSYDFTIDAADQAAMLQIAFDYNASANFVAGSSSPSITASDVTVWIYDKTNGVIIPVSPFVLTGNGTNNFNFKGIFQANPNSTSYRLILHIGSTNALAWTLTFVNIYTGPQSRLFGSPVTDWQSYTPSVPTNLTLGNGTITGDYRRLGDSVQVRVIIQAGSTTSISAQVMWQNTLPSGLSIDTTKLPVFSTQVIGGANYYKQSTAAQYSAYARSDGGTIYMGLSSGTGFVGVLDATHPVTLAGGDFLSMDFIVPVFGWSSTVQMSNDTDTRVVAAQYFATSIAIANAAVVQFNTKSIDTHGAVTIGTGWLFRAPVSGIYSIYGFIQPSSVTTSNIFGWQKNGGGNSIQLLAMTTNSQYYYFSDTLQLVAGDTVALNTSAGGFTFNAGEINFVRLTGPSAIASTEVVAAKYVTCPAANPTGQTLAWITKVFDTHNAYNTSTGVYTCPVAGIYRVQAQLLLSSGASSSVANNAIYLHIVQNGVDKNVLAYWDYQATGVAIQPMPSGITLLQCNAGDTITITIFKDAGIGTITNPGQANYDYLCIDRLKN
jgi:C1q domain-containing protein